MLVNLPRWILVNKFPALYDTESLTVIEQTARVYAKVNELIDSYNSFAEEFNKKYSEFAEAENKEDEIFKTALRQEFQDFINVVDLKVRELEQYAKNTLNSEIKKLWVELKDTGELQEVFKTFIDELAEQLDTIDKALKDLTNEYEGSKEDIETLQEELQTITSDIAEYKLSIEKQFEDMQVDYDSKIEAVNKRVDELPKPKMVYTPNTDELVTEDIDFELDYNKAPKSVDFTKMEVQHNVSLSNGKTLFGVSEYGSEHLPCVDKVTGTPCLEASYSYLRSHSITNQGQKMSVIYDVTPESTVVINCTRNGSFVNKGCYDLPMFTMADGFIIKTYTSEDKVTWSEHEITVDDGLKFNFIISVPKNHTYLKIEFPQQHSLIGTDFSQTFSADDSIVGNDVFGVTDITLGLTGEVESINGLHLRDNKAREEIDKTNNEIANLKNTMGGLLFYSENQISGEKLVGKIIENLLKYKFIYVETLLGGGFCYINNGIINGAFSSYSAYESESGSHHQDIGNLLYYYNKQTGEIYEDRSIYISYYYKSDSGVYEYSRTQQPQYVKAIYGIL